MVFLDLLVALATMTATGGRKSKGAREARAMDLPQIRRVVYKLGGTGRKLPIDLKACPDGFASEA
jgi:hypothetical protein